MADDMFSEPFVHIGSKQNYTVLLSVAAHAIVIAAAIVAPLVATDTIVLPARLAMAAFTTEPPLPPSPPPPRDAARAAPVSTRSAIPLVAPAAIVRESPIAPMMEPLPEAGYSTGIIDGSDFDEPPPAKPAAVPALPQAPVRPGGDIRPPTKVKDVAPAYPATARAARVEGFVIIEAIIGPDGKVQNARVIRSNPLLDAAALDAVRQWEYTPTRLNGTPIAILMTVTVNFRLR